MTAVVVMGALVVLLGYEGWTLFNKRPNDTISESIRRGAKKYMVIVFLAGLLCGHWFWPLITEGECREEFPCPLAQPGRP